MASHDLGQTRGGTFFYDVMLIITIHDDDDTNDDSDTDDDVDIKDDDWL